jgi:hypothetical protein
MSTSASTARTTITDVLDALQANLPNLKPGIRYTLQDLVGYTFWYSMSTGTRKHLGLEFKALVVSGCTPVECGGRRTDNCHVYQLK